MIFQLLAKYHSIFDKKKAIFVPITPKVRTISKYIIENPLSFTQINPMKQLKGFNSIYFGPKILFITIKGSQKWIFGKKAKNMDGRLEFASDIKTIRHWCHLAQIS